MFRVKELLKPAWAKVGASVGVLLVLATLIDLASRLEFVVSLRQAPIAFHVFSFLVSPLGRLLSVLAVSCAGWYMLYRDFQKRFPKRKGSTIISVSASVIFGSLREGIFVPTRDDKEMLAIFCLYNEGSTIPGDISATLTMRGSAGENIVVRDACWLNERDCRTRFKRSAYRFLVLAEWTADRPISIPYHTGKLRGDHELSESVGINITLLRGQQKIS